MPARGELSFHRVARGLRAAGIALLLARSAGAIDVRLPGTERRLSVTGYVDGQAVVDTGGGPRQRPQASTNLELDSAITDWLSAHGQLRGQVGGPYEGGDSGFFNFVHTFQNWSPSLELGELYVDAHGASTELRFGWQRFAWGKLDGVPPSDVINPRDFHDSLVQDFEEAKVSVPAVMLSYYPPDLERAPLSQLRASLIWVPIAVPPRLPLVDERWFPPTTSFSGVAIPPALLDELGLDFDDPIPVDLSTANKRPPFTLDAGGIAVRLSGTWGAADWDLYHYSGPETAPNARLLATVHGNLQAMPPKLRADAVLQQTHDTIHMFGGDLAVVVGGATIRSEAAFFLDRHYLRPAGDLVDDLFEDGAAVQGIFDELAATRQAPVPLGDLFAARDSVEWGIGVDYVIHGFFPLVQLNQIIILEPAPRLLIADPETRLTVLLRRRFWQDRFEVELRSFYAMERGSWFVLPRLSYSVTDDLRLRLGYLAVGGPDQSLIGQFSANDEVIIQARYSF